MSSFLWLTNISYEEDNMKYTDKIVKLVEAVDVKLSGEDNEGTKDFLLAQFNKLPAYFTAVIEGNVRLAIMGDCPKTRNRNPSA